jgi:hypothetical protein
MVSTTIGGSRWAPRKLPAYPETERCARSVGSPAREDVMWPNRAIEKVVTALGAAPLLVLGVLVLLSGISLLGDAWGYYQRRADAQLMWFLFAWDSVRRLTYATAVLTLLGAAFMLPAHRAVLLLVDGALALAVGIWAITQMVGTAGPSDVVIASVLAGVCALSAAGVLIALHLTMREPDRSG